MNRLVVPLVAAVVVCPMPVDAQRGQDAGLVGVVRDSSGGAVEDATVAVSSPQLIGGEHTTKTDAAGAYRFPILTPGTYRIAVDSAGLQSVVRDGVVLQSGQTLTLHFDLAVAQLVERLEIDALSPIVDVRTSSSSTVLDRRLLENLPLARTVANFVNLAPGVISDVAYGGALIANPLFLDGAGGNEPGFGTPTALPSANWIEEVQIVALGADAQFGEFEGARVNAITRSGANHYSGLVDYKTKRRNWTGNNRGTLSPQLQQQFRPIEILNNWDLDVQLGGPVWKDRLWFFAGGVAYRDATRPVSFSGVPRQPDEPRKSIHEHKYIGKLTSSLSPSVRVDGFVVRISSDTDAFNASPLVQPDALASINDRVTLWNGRVLWTPRSDTVWDFRSGGSKSGNYTGPPAERRHGPSARFDTLTGVLSGNYPMHSVYEFRPLTAETQLTYLPSRLPRHELKAGAEVEHVHLLSASGLIDGKVFFDVGGPMTVQIQPDSMYRPTQLRVTSFVQDAWSIADRITLNLGARFSRYTGSVPSVDAAFSAATVSPRLGVAWQMTDRHGTVLRAHYGHYHEPFVTNLYDFRDPLSEQPVITAQVIGADQFVEISRSASAQLATIDPGTKYAFTEEIVTGVESELRWGVAGQIQFIRRDFKDTVGFVDPGSTWNPTQRQDPGPDGISGTSDDGGFMTVYLKANATTSSPLILTNPAEAYRRYHAFQFIANKRYSHNTKFIAAYTWSRTVGSYNNLAFSNAAGSDLGPVSGVFINPNRRINTEGRTPQDFTHEIKVYGTYRLARLHGVNISGVYRYQSGRTWARSARFAGATLTNMIFVEPRAMRQLPAVNVVDLRVEKTWQPFRRATLGVLADVFNVTNQGVPLRVNNLSGPNLGVPTQWSEPRVLRGGIRMLF